MIVRGLFHLHTSVSKDATLTHEQYVAHASKCGHSFALFAEHRDRMTDDEVREAVARCDALSTGEFLLVPGQEQECPEPLFFHVVGIGVREPIRATAPGDVVAEIRERGGLSVLAHPARYRAHPPPPDLLDAVDGIEVFNLRYDGRHGVREEVRALLDDRPDTLALGGLDAHDPDDLGRVESPVLAVEVERLAEADLLSAIAAGRFSVAMGGRPVDLRRPVLVARRFAAAGRRGLFAAARGTKRGLDRLGIRMPRSWVRAVRRRF